VPIKLTHVGELLIEAMLRLLKERRKLDQLRCARTDTKFTKDLGTGAPTFLPEKALLRVRTKETTYSCDGAQAVDILCTCNNHAVAIEAKLGDTRMTRDAFKKRFCDPCEVQERHPSLLKGSMVAVLDGDLPFRRPQVFATTGEGTWPLSENWWLVIREHIWKDSWDKPKGRPLPVRHARILVFDERVRLYGTRAEFNQLVREVAADDYSAAWNLNFET
jgi:hypothetical protein